MKDADRLRQLRDLFDQAMDLPEAERAGFVASQDQYDPGFRRELEQLLTGADRTDARLEPVIRPPVGEGSDLIGQRLGAYDIVRLVGLGGMGAVYEAVRADDQYRKRVAIKLVQRGLDSEVTLARFRRERQILASLEHKNIATLLDGGVTPDGRPFLVMEYVEGQPITAWCDERRLPVRDRIALFRQVCSAVQHAHRNLVIHRDLKPGNILVTDDGTAKLLDFGIAKLVGGDTGDDLMPLTRGGARAFTPEYASPEQIRGSGLTTASDLYSLGVVLFELLAGRRPYLVSGAALVEIERAVLEDPVPRPSTVTTDSAARARGERDAGRLRARLQSELDNVVLETLRLEPARRYPSVEALGDDLRRYLAGLPVQAQGAWAGYRFAKFVQRNRAAVIASALVLVALIGGGISTLLEARRAQASQRRAERVNQFLRTVLSSVKPATGGRDVPVSEVLDSAARRVRIELEGDPSSAAELETVIGQSYASLGRYDDAERHFTAALELRRRSDGARSLAVADALSHLAGLLLDKGDIDRADSIFRTAVAMEREYGSPSDSLLISLVESQGSVAHAQGKPAEAERLHRQALALRRKQLGDRDDRVAYAMNNVAVALGEQNKWAGAESLHRAALAILRTNHPEPNPLVADAENGLAGALDIQGKNVEAESAYVRVLDLRKKLLGPDHPNYAYTEFSYAFFLADLGRWAEAAALSRHVLSLRGKTLADSHPAVAASFQLLGRSLDHAGDHAGAEEALDQAVAIRRKYLPPGSWLVGSSERILAEHYILTRDYPRAESLALDAYGVLVKGLGADHPNARLGARTLVTLYDAWGRPARAAEFRAKLPADSTH